MIINCLKTELSNAIATVQKAISTKPSISPILTGIYLSAEEDNTLTLQATDYELAIVTKINVSVEKPGKIVISGKYLTDIIKKINGTTITLETDEENKKIRISSEHIQYTLLTMNHEDFPTIKPLIGSSFIKLDVGEFKNIVRKTTFACSNDEVRPLFNGCLFEITDGKLIMVATDTHRMAVKSIGFEQNNEQIKIIIPSKILNEIVKIIGSEDEKEISILWQKNEIAFSFDNVYLKSRLIEGQFPNYRNVIPSCENLTITVNRINLAETVERVSLLSSSIYNIMKMSCSGQSIIFSTNNPDIGRATEVLSAKSEGTDMEVIFNARYILDILKHLESDEIIIKLNTPSSAALIETTDDPDYKYVLTPVRTNSM